MPSMVDFFEKHETANCGETNKDTSEMITVTIALAEYRSLVEENARLNLEKMNFGIQLEQAFKEKAQIEEQWKQEKEWFKKQIEELKNNAR